MSSTPRKVYPISLPLAEYEKLQAKADQQGVSLAHAFREGAKLFFSEEGQLTAASNNLEEAVAKATRVLQSYNKKEG